MHVHVYLFWLRGFSGYFLLQQIRNSDLGVSPLPIIVADKENFKKIKTN